MDIKVVDFTGIRAAADITPAVIDQLHEAFTTIGFVIITNHGVEEKARTSFSVCRKFFDQPVEEKVKVQVTKETNTSGYGRVEQEKMRPDVGDLKEFFHITDDGLTQVWPANNDPFKTTMQELYSSMQQVAFIILECMARALKLEDPLYFVKRHQHARAMKRNNGSMRVHNYPAVPPGTVKPGQLRCGEHIDFGSITLLFADRPGGLQVKNSSGQYIIVPHLPEAIQVNIGAVMQRWTGDQYIAPLHKVVVPDDGTQNDARLSIPLFIHPDGDTLVECVDGSNKHPPILARDEYAERCARVYFN